MAYTTIDDPSAYFQTATYTGTGSTQSITNDGNSDLQPDWVWVKSRSNGGTNHVVFDSSRGVNNRLIPNLTIAEDTGDGYGVVSAFNTDGFTVNPQTNLINVGGDGYTYAAWQWKANGGTTSSNTDGSITSIVQANTDAGFSIITYTGNSTNPSSIGHGLGVVPNFYMIKQRNSVNAWKVYHSGMAAVPEDYVMELNTTGAREDNTIWNDTGPTSSVINFTDHGAVNQSGDTYVAYCFAEKQGYSKFGKYVGNGNANGPFVYTGFKPAFIMWKRTSGTSDWVIWDNKRDPDNAVLKALYPSDAGAESTSSDGTGTSIDILSNGFKMRTNNAVMNGNGEDFIYMAFAENPFVTSTGIPTTAR